MCKIFSSDINKTFENITLGINYKLKYTHILIKNLKLISYFILYVLKAS